ncbi:MAG: hypothetical protein IJJ88_03815 [Oscillospiraceae bacterium]|nr:hypothetical protein [Oscillospiraceae bacterium]
MKKRLLSLALSFVMVLTMLPVSVWAEMADNRISFTGWDTLPPVTASEDESGDELLLGYLYEQAGLTEKPAPVVNDPYHASSPAMMGVARGTALTGLDKAVYDAAKTMAAQVADGSVSDAVVTVTDSVDFTAEQAGVEAFTNDNLGDVINSLYDINDRLHLQAVQNALISDLPYDLYWYDKTEGINTETTSYVSGTSEEVTLTVTCDFYFTVAEDYAAGSIKTENGTYRCVADTTKTGAAKQAAVTARGVVDSYSDKQDYEKLQSYLTYVDGQVSYDKIAASSPNTPYGDPWQLIYVFDGDDSTNVVCEGYAKAFKFLCDLTENWSDPDFDCYLVTGYMDGGTGAGAHMWNIVHIRDANNPNGGNFMVDPTNCDEGSAGAPDMMFMKAPKELDEDGKYHFAANSQSGEIVYTYSDTAQTTFTTAELTLAAQDYEEPAAQPELAWQWGFLSDNGFVTESESRGQMEVSVFDEFSGRLVYIDANGNATELSLDDVTFTNRDKLDVTVDGSILRLRALAEGVVTLTYGDVSFVLHINVPPVAFYADQAAETLLGSLDYDGTNVTVYLAVKDDAVSITAVEPGEGVQDVTKLNDTLYSVTIGTLDSERITVLVSGKMGDNTAEQAPISLPVNDRMPGLVWHWLDWRDDTWQENGTNRYWDDWLGNEPMGYIAYHYENGDEQRLTDDALSQLTFKGVQFALEKEEGETYSRVHLLLDSLGVASVSLPEGQTGQPVKIRVEKPEIGLSTDANGVYPMAMWVLDGTNNDTAYIYWPEDVLVSAINREDGNSNKTVISIAENGRYAQVTLQEVGEDWLSFAVHATRQDRPEEENTYWVSTRLVDRRPGVRFYWVDGDWYEGTVEKIWDNDPQSRLELAPNDVAYIQLAYFDGQDYHSIDDGYTIPDVLEKAERKQEQCQALRAVGFGSGTITYTVDGTPYSLPVSVTLPKVGFYKSSEATKENYLRSWSFTGEDDIFYLLWPENATLQSLSVDEHSRTAIQVVNEGTMTTDGYAQIEVLSYVDDWIGVDVRFRYEGQDHDDGYYANLHLENNAPGLSFLWVDGDWNRDDTFTIWEDQDPQSQLNMAVDGNAFIQLNFHDGQGNSQPVTDLDNVAVSGAVSREKIVQGQYLVLRPEGFGSGTITYTVNGKAYTLPVVVELPELGFYDTAELPVEGSEGWEAEWQAHYVTCWNFQDKNSVVYLVPLHGGSIQSVEPHDGNEMDWRGTVGENGAYASFRLNRFSGAGELGAVVTFVRDGAQDNDTWDRWLTVTDGRENPLSATADMTCDYDAENDIYWVRDLSLGTDVTLQAKVEGDSGGCTYQWYENGFDPERGGHYSEIIEDATGLNLTVEDLRRNRGFTLRVTRKVDDTYSEICNVTFELCIKNDLHFTVTTEAATTYYGGTVDVAATMTAGEGAVTDGLFYEWYHVDTYEGFGGPDIEMTLDGVTRGGTYRLQVWDCYGNLIDADGKVEITVRPAQPGRVYLAHTNRDYGNGDVLEIYQGDTIHLGVTNAGYTNEATLPEGDLWLCTWDPAALTEAGFRFYGADDESGEEFTGKDDFESPYGPYVDARNVQPGDYELTFGYQLMSQLNDAENAESYDTFTITIRVKAPEAKTVWNGEEFANGGTIYVQPGQTGINPVADFQLDLINDFAVVAWDPQTLRQAGFTVDDEPLWVQYQGENTAVPNISVPENLAPGTKATLTWRIVRGSTSPVANGENTWEDAETVYTYTVTIAIPERGNVNGAANALGKSVDASDMQCLFEYLSLGKINSSLVKDENDSTQVDYFRTVADANEDGLVNILDYQALYEIVKAQ